MAEIKERLLEYLKISKITKQNFCEKTGISLWNITGKSVKSELGGEQIAKIIGQFPNLNPDWLLLGKGEMLRENTPEREGTDYLHAGIDALTVQHHADHSSLEVQSIYTSHFDPQLNEKIYTLAPDF